MADPPVDGVGGVACPDQRWAGSGHRPQRRRLREPQSADHEEQQHGSVHDSAQHRLGHRSRRIGSAPLVSALMTAKPVSRRQASALVLQSTTTTTARTDSSRLAPRVPPVVRRGVRRAGLALGHGGRGPPRVREPIRRAELHHILSCRRCSPGAWSSKAIQYPHAASSAEGVDVLRELGGVGGLGDGMVASPSSSSSSRRRKCSSLSTGRRRWWPPPPAPSSRRGSRRQVEPAGGSDVGATG